MELIKFSFLVIAVLAPSSQACTQQTVMACVEQNQEIITLAATAAQNPQNAQKLCRMYKDFSTCFQNAIADCSPEMKNGMDTIKQGFAIADQMCDESQPCNMMKMLKCTEGFPMTEQETQNPDYRKLCGALPKTSTCINNLKEQCGNVQELAGILQQTSAVFPTMDAECKKMYGEDYATKGVGNGSSMVGFSFLASLAPLLVAALLK